MSHSFARVSPSGLVWSPDWLGTGERYFLGSGEELGLDHELLHGLPDGEPSGLGSGGKSGCGVAFLRREGREDCPAVLVVPW